MAGAPLKYWHDAQSRALIYSLGFGSAEGIPTIGRNANCASPRCPQNHSSWLLSGATGCTQRQTQRYGGANESSLFPSAKPSVYPEVVSSATNLCQLLYSFLMLRCQQ